MNILEEYCNIFRDTNIHEKKERQNKLQCWSKQSYGHLPDFETLSNWLSEIDKQNDVEITYQLEVKVIFPVCDIEIFQNNNIEAMKLILLKLPESLHAEQKFMEHKSNFSFNLLDMALKSAPNDNELLYKLYERETSFYSFSIHEVPSGVLCGMNGATIEQAKGMLLDLVEYKSLCKRLNKLDDKHEMLIETCSSYYVLWIEFLTNKTKYRNFDHCLKKHDILLERNMYEME